MYVLKCNNQNTLPRILFKQSSLQAIHTIEKFIKPYIFSWLQSWQLGWMGWMQCDLRRWNQDKNKRYNPGTRTWRRCLSGSWGNNSLQYWQMQRYSCHVLYHIYRNELMFPKVCVCVCVAYFFVFQHIEWKWLNTSSPSYRYDGSRARTEHRPGSCSFAACCSCSGLGRGESIVQRSVRLWSMMTRWLRFLIC